MFTYGSNDHSAIFTFGIVDDEIEDLGFCRKDSILRIFDYVQREMNHVSNTIASKRDPSAFLRLAQA